MSDQLNILSYDPLIFQVAGAGTGAHVTSGFVDGSNHLILTLSDGTSVDCGALPSGGGAAGVSSFNSRTGAVSLTKADVTGTGLTAADVNADASGAATAAQAAAVQRANHTGTQSADTLTDGTTNKAFLATERTKLAGVATGATANSSDATLLNRANHTGTQLMATISDAGGAATKNVGTATGTVAAGDDSRITGAAQKANNLSDLASASTARTNLGLAALAQKAAIAVPGDITATGTPSSTTYLRGDGAWATPAGGGGGLATDTLADAKGDLFVGSADNTIIRKAVGSDGSVLRARSGQSGGIGWSPEFLGQARAVAVNEWRSNYDNNGGTLGLASGQMVLAFTPIPFDFTLDGLSFVLNSVATTGTIRIVLFSDNAGVPGTGLVDSGAISITSGAGWKTVTGLAYAGTRGNYWAGLLAESITGSPTFTNNAGPSGPWAVGGLGTGATPSGGSISNDGYAAMATGVSGSQVGQSFTGTMKSDHNSPARIIPVLFRFSAVTL